MKSNRKRPTLELSKPFTYGSVCSGIEAATVAWKPLGWHCSFMSEIDRFPCAVLKNHYLDTPLHGDFTTIKHNQYADIDLLVGGTPCQSFSIAGLRGGLDDDRGNLALEFLKLTDRLRPKWVVWENVPGVLSSNGGKDFGTFLGALGELGYGFAYRVLDAQYFGVPQRRRRVFVVGYFGDWRRAAAVLFERESLRRNSPPSRKAGERTPETITYGIDESGGAGGSVAGTLCASYGTKWNGNAAAYSGSLFVTGTQGATYGAKWGSNQDIQEGMSLYPVVTDPPTSRPYADNASQESKLVVMATGQGNAEITTDICSTLNCNHEAPIVYDIMHMNSGKDYKAKETYTSRTITTDGCHGGNQGGTYVAENSVRRLTPIECERLQGFPDNFTKIAYRGKHSDDCPDGPRYKAIGNSMAVPVMGWIGERIQKLENINKA